MVRINRCRNKSFLSPQKANFFNSFRNGSESITLACYTCGVTLNTLHFDQLHRFIFDEAHIRGELVQLKDSLNTLLDTHEYPQCLQQLLAEMMLATSLLTATLKFEGEISMQLQGKGKLKYAVISGSDDQKLRGIARWEGNLGNESFQELTSEDGTLAITIMPKKGQQYQSIVALNKPTLAGCLKEYFRQSEQLATEIILHTNFVDEKPVAAGILLQSVPESDTSFQEQNDAFEHLTHLTNTITTAELTELPVNDILHRLYHEEQVKLFEAIKVSFSCTCSRERIASALSSIPRSELMSILEEKESIKTNCQYCFAEYIFTEQEIIELLGPSPDEQHKLH